MENEEMPNKDGICLVKICILGILIVGCGISFIKAINRPNKVEVTYIIQTDSLGNISTESKMYVDSLMQITKTREQNFDDRYEFFLQQRETFQDYITWTSLVVSIVLTVLGFLGYRSLSSMENKIRQQLKGTLYKDIYD
jgi:amino acid transporter